MRKTAARVVKEIDVDFPSLVGPPGVNHLEADKKGRRKTPDTTLLTLSTLVTKHPHIRTLPYQPYRPFLRSGFTTMQRDGRV